MDFDPNAIRDVLQTAKVGLSALDVAVGTIKKLRELTKSKPTEPADPKLLEIRTLVVDLQEQLLAAREEALRFRQAALAASEALLREDDFETRRKSYLRVELLEGNFAYEQTGEVEEGARALACATCFEQERKIVTLQLARKIPGKDTLRCPKCGTRTSRRNEIEPERSPERPSWLASRRGHR